MINPYLALLNSQFFSIHVKYIRTSISGLLAHEIDSLFGMPLWNYVAG